MGDTKVASGDKAGRDELVLVLWYVAAGHRRGKYKMYTITENVNRFKEHLMLSEIKGVGNLRGSPHTAKLLICEKELKKR